MQYNIEQAFVPTIHHKQQPTTPTAQQPISPAAQTASLTQQPETQLELKSEHTRGPLCLAAEDLMRQAQERLMAIRWTPKGSKGPFGFQQAFPLKPTSTLKLP